MVNIGRGQLIRTVASQTGLSQKQITEVLDAILGVFKSTLISKGKVSIPGWFTMGTKLRKGRTGRNPRTGEALIIPEKNIPYIKAGTELKEAAEE
ncbi:HU family DNA-binding protein [Gammaproteobacteria bacterium]|nr:HU family DNA-binding protein [Gammaproteobacteria bacterium]